MKTFLLISLMAVTATATMVRPDGATLEVSSNIYYGMTYKDFRVFYQGVSDRASYNPDDTCKDVVIKIFKEGDCEKDTPVHTYTVPGGRKSKPGIFYFSLQNAVPGTRFDVQVCHGNVCSYRSTSMDEIPLFRGKLECYRVIYEKKTKTEKPAGDFALDMLPIKDFQKDISNTTKWKVAKTYGISSSPLYKDGVLYTSFEYNIGHYKPLFDIAKDDAEKEQRTQAGDPYTDVYCTRKYGLMVSVQLVNPHTKEIEYRFKETQYLAPEFIKKYLSPESEQQQQDSKSDSSSVSKEQKADPLLPVEVVFKDDKIKPGTYTLMVAICPTAKDILDFKVGCADSLAKEDFVIPAPNATTNEADQQ